MYLRFEIGVHLGVVWRRCFAGNRLNAASGLRAGCAGCSDVRDRALGDSSYGRYGPHGHGARAVPPLGCLPPVADEGGERREDGCRVRVSGARFRGAVPAAQLSPPALRTSAFTAHSAMPSSTRTPALT